VVSCPARDRTDLVELSSQAFLANYAQRTQQQSGPKARGRSHGWCAYSRGCAGLVRTWFCRDTFLARASASAPERT